MKKLLMILILVACLGTASAQTKPAQDSRPTAGVVTQLRGSVEVQSEVVNGPSSTLEGESRRPPGNAGTLDQLSPLPTQFMPWTLARGGQTLTNGASVRTGKGSGVVLSLSDGVELQLDAETEVRVSATGLEVRQGRLWVRTDRPLNLETPQGRAQVTGTELVLSAGPTSSTVTVMEGEVELGEVTVGAGQQLAYDGVPSQPVEIQVEQPKAWVQEQRTTPGRLALEPFFANAAQRDAAREKHSGGNDQASRLQMARVYLDEYRLEEARRAMAGLKGPKLAHLEGRLALLDSDFPTALGKLANAGPEAALDLGVAQWASTDLDAAQRAFGERLRNQPDSAYALAAQAYLVDFQKGHYRRAVAGLERATAKVDDPLLHRQLGDCYAALKRNGAAVEQFERAIELGLGEDPETALRMGSLLTRIGRAQEALQYFEKFREQSDDENAELHHALAAGYTKLYDGDLSKAMELADKALKEAEGSNPGLAYLALDLQGLIFSSQKAYGQAADRYQAALKGRPDDPYLLNDLGIALRATGSLSEALTSLRTAREKAPDAPAIRGNLGRLYLLLQQNQRAQAEFEQALAMSPSDPSLMLGLGNTYRAVGRVAAADRLERQSYYLDPLLIAPRNSLTAFLATTSPETGPDYVASHSGKHGPFSYFLSGLASLNESAVGQTADLVSPRGTLGWVASPRDRLTLELGQGRTTFDPLTGQSFLSNGDNTLSYYRELSAHTSLWALLTTDDGFARTHNDIRPLDNLRDSESKITTRALEVRLDQDLGPDNTLSVGYSTRDSDTTLRRLSFLATGNSASDQSRDFESFWIADSWAIGPHTQINFGASFDSFQQAQTLTTFSAAGNPTTTNTAADGNETNPFIGLTTQLDPETRLSLSAIRQSDLTSLADGTAFNFAQQRLMPITVSSTSLFPLSFFDRTVLLANSLDGASSSLPFWDYRLRVTREFNSHVFAAAELYHTDVMAAEGRDTTLLRQFANVPLFRNRLNLLSNESHDLDGARLDVEFWDGGDFTGRATYNYRDFRYSSGPDNGKRWLAVPEHSFDLQLFAAATDELTLELNPSLLSETFLDSANTTKIGGYFQMDVAAHWYPVPGSRVSLGYQNLFSENKSPVEPGLFSNVIFTF